MLLENMLPKSSIFLYGNLEGKPLVFDTIKMIERGLNLESFITGRWWMSVSEETKVRVRAKYSSYLKGELSTKLFKELALANIEEAIELSVSHSLEGKVFLKPE